MLSILAGINIASAPIAGSVCQRKEDEAHFERDVQAITPCIAKSRLAGLPTRPKESAMRRSRFIPAKGVKSFGIDGRNEPFRSALVRLS